MTELEESAAFAHRQVVNAQTSLLVKNEHDGHCHCFDVEEQQLGGWKEVLCGFCIHFVDHASLVDLVRVSKLRLWSLILTLIDVNLRVILPQCAIVLPAFAL